MRSTPTDARERTLAMRTVPELQAALAPWHRAGASVGAVPTMGALHEGHLALIRAARERCDVVVVSLFVNPAQFNERADLERYPRREAHDAELAASAGADVLFAPDADEVYPDGFSTYVEVVGLTDKLEGAIRGSAHFRGVTTVVTKLFNMVGPDVAFFGRKDAQQLAVLRRLVADLNIPVEIVAVPTVREADGLAMSSRNALLGDEGRRRARGLPAALSAARALVERGETGPATICAAARQELSNAMVEPEYIALVDPETFDPLAELTGDGLLLLAARVEDVRLIDNEVLTARQPRTVPEEALQCNA